MGDLMFQTADNSQLLRRVLWINAELTIVWSLKHKNTQPSYIFNRENPQNSEPQNGPRRGLDFIALILGSSKERFSLQINGTKWWVISVPGLADPWQCSAYGGSLDLDPFWRTASWFDSVQPQLVSTRWSS